MILETLIFKHNSTSVSLKINSTINENGDNEAYGFREVVWLIYPCFDTCASCNGPD